MLKDKEKKEARGPKGRVRGWRSWGGAESPLPWGGAESPLPTS